MPKTRYTKLLNSKAFGVSKNAKRTIAHFDASQPDETQLKWMRPRLEKALYKQWEDSLPEHCTRTEEKPERRVTVMNATREELVNALHKITRK